MIKFEHTEVFGWEAAIRGMRNPMNSWDKSDSDWDLRSDKVEPEWFYRIGENDLALMKKLAKAGNDHSKFLRMINVTADITAPRYWWTEYDTYKVGTVANSCSTMHKIHEKEFTLDDFSHEHLNRVEDVTLVGDVVIYDAKQWLSTTIAQLNFTRAKYLETKDKEFWYQMIQMLPSAYNQKRTVKMNYQVLKNMYHARKNHKLDEWREFCKWCETLPYFRDICVEVTE